MLQGIDKVSSVLAPAAPFLMEFLGTYCLITAVVFSSVDVGALAVSLMLVAVVFMGGHISGAHYNPAVTFGVFCSGREKLSLKEAIGYIVAQVLASLVSSFVNWGLAYDVVEFMHAGSLEIFYTPEIMPGGTWIQALAAELIATFVLVSVVLSVGTSKKVEGNSFFGLAIGFTVGAFAYAFGPISGGVFNPAVGTGPLIVDAIATGDISQMQWIWLYWLAPMSGGFLASILYRVTHHHSDYLETKAHGLAPVNDYE